MTRDRRELLGVLATAGGHLATVAWPTVHGVFVAVCVLAWVVWLFRTARREPERVVVWGFSRRALGPAAAWTVAFGVVAIGVMAAVAWQLGSLQVRAHYVFPALLYPLWGLIQQFLVQGIVARQLSERLGPVLTTLVAATLFGLIHVPFPDLMAATFGLGLVLTPLYLRYGNLWPLGFAHGWLGTLVYPWILGRDPWLEMMGGSGMG